MRRAPAALAALLALLALVAHARAEVYLHNPRGSNNRNCRSNRNNFVRNPNRLFNSQNSGRGGYSCPRAWPFNCYTRIGNNEAFNACMANNVPGSPDQLDSDGELTSSIATKTGTMYYYSTSELTLQMTVQQGLGDPDEQFSQVIIQYACEDTLTDNCNFPNAETNPFEVNENAQTCTLRDGTPVNNGESDANNLNAEANERIQANAQAQSDMRFGRHETLAYFSECSKRERNKGLFTADQILTLGSARSSRQNPGGSLFGLECAEEAAYYPYWHHSPWKDIAIFTSDTSKCDFYRRESQNVLGKGRCQCGSDNCGFGTQPNQKQSCETAGGRWVTDPSHNLPPPACLQAPFARQNHLGNVGGTTDFLQFNWTVPKVASEQKCVLRVRYNVTSRDFNGVLRTADSASNGEESFIKDLRNSESESYRSIKGLGDGAALGFNINTQNFGRTFQDRSYVFKIRPRDENTAGCQDIYNINVRGKRGSIDSIFPAVPYDFVPKSLLVEEGDCIHTQWTGSDYNSGGDDDFGGPFAANSEGKDLRSDRSNMVQTWSNGDNFPRLDLSSFNMFSKNADYKRLAFLDQNIDNTNICLPANSLPGSSRRDRINDHRNCMTLSGADTPYFDGGVQKVGAIGKYTYMSTRNNEFGVRLQKGFFEVVADGTKPSLVNPEEFDPAVLIGPIVGGVAFLAFIAVLVVVLRRRRHNHDEFSPMNKDGAGVAAIAPILPDRNSNPASSTSASATSRFLKVPLKGSKSGSSKSLRKSSQTSDMAESSHSSRDSEGDNVSETGSTWSKATKVLARGRTKSKAKSTGPEGPLGTAKYDYVAKEAGELSFKKGDQVVIVSRDESGWGVGELDGRRGVLPLNYLK